MASNSIQTNSSIKVICLLVGIPASGKTTFTHNFKEYLKTINSKLDIICVEFDSYLPRDTRCTHEPSAEPAFQWRKHRDDMRLHIHAFLDTQDKGLLPKDRISVLILDDTFHYRSMRYEYYRLARERGLGFKQLFFQINLEESLLRNKSRERRIPEETISTIWGQLVSPIGSLLKWEQETIVLDATSEIPFDLIAAKLEEAATHPLTSIDDTPHKSIEREISRKETLSSVSHQSDVILRKLVGSMIRVANECGMEREEVVIYAERCNRKRKEILNELSVGKWSQQATQQQDLEDLLRQLMSEVMM